MIRAAPFATFLAVVVLAGCGGGDDEPGTSPPAGPTAAELDFVYRADDSAEPERITLSCPGSDRAADETCRELGRVPAGTFDPVPAGTACTEIYGGPETLRVSGRLGDETIQSGFSRVNGCEIARWDAVSPVLRSLGVGEVGPGIAR